MKKIKLHHYFWIVSIFFISLSLYWRTIKDAVIDFNIHDTYYIISHFDLSILFSVFYAFVGIVYWVFFFKKITLINILTKMHSIITLIIVPAYFIGSSIIDKRSNSNFPLFDDGLSLQWFLFILGILFGFAQILFVFNVVYGLIKYFFFKK